MNHLIGLFAFALVIGCGAATESERASAQPDAMLGATGGDGSTEGIGGQSASAGTSAPEPVTGGSAATGGRSATGGAIASTGGSAATGGRSATGGQTATGGRSSTGGQIATGGRSSNGGQIACLLVSSKDAYGHNTCACRCDTTKDFRRDPCTTNATSCADGNCSVCFDDPTCTVGTATSIGTCMDFVTDDRGKTLGVHGFASEAVCLTALTALTTGPEPLPECMP